MGDPIAETWDAYFRQQRQVVQVFEWHYMPHNMKYQAAVERRDGTREVVTVDRREDIHLA